MAIPSSMAHLCQRALGKGFTRFVNTITLTVYISLIEYCLHIQLLPFHETNTGFIDALNAVYPFKSGGGTLETRYPALSAKVSRALALDPTTNHATEITAMGHGAPTDQFALVMPHTAGAYDQTSDANKALHSLLYQLSNSLLTEQGEVALLDLLEAIISSGSTLQFAQSINSAELCATSATILDQLLKISIQHRRCALVKLCLQLGANPNLDADNRWYRRQPISVITAVACRGFFDLDRTGATERLDHEIFNTLLENGACVTESTLILSLAFKTTWMTEHLISYQGLLDVHRNYQKTIETVSTSWTDYRILPFIPDFLNSTPLVVAALWENEHSIQLLGRFLSRNATPDLDAMIAAACAGNAQAIRLLHEHGAPVDGLNGHGFSPLTATTCIFDQDKRLEVCSLLLELGASPCLSPTHPQYGIIPSALHLHCAVSEADIRVIDLLIEAGSDMNCRAPSEEETIGKRWTSGVDWTTAPSKDCLVSKPEISPTLLEYAVCNGNSDAAKHLLSKGCRLTGRELLIATKKWRCYRRRFPQSTDMISFLETLIRMDPSQIRARDSRGHTVLQNVITIGRYRIFEMLLKLGINIQPGDILRSDVRRLGPWISGRTSSWSSDNEIQLLHAMPNLNRVCQGVSDLEIVCGSASKVALRFAFSLYPDAYDSGALYAVVFRALQNEVDSTDIEEILKRRSSANKDARKESTIVAIAALAGRFDLVKMFTDHEAHIYSAYIPLVHVREILTRGLRPADMVFWSNTPIFGGNTMLESSPLTAACMSEEMDINRIVGHLLSCGHEPDGWTHLMLASCNRITTLQLFQRLRFDITEHVDRPPWCPTILQMAVRSGSVEMVRLLLEAGAVVDERESPPCAPIRSHNDGMMLPRTALQYAVELGRMDLITILLDSGANVNAPAARDSGATALQIASIKGYLPLARYLIEQGANLDAPGASWHGRTSLQGAAEHGRLDMLRFLLDCGAATEDEYCQPYIKAVIYAEKRGHQVIANILREHRQWLPEDRETYDILQDEWDHREKDFMPGQGRVIQTTTKTTLWGADWEDAS